MTCTTCGTQVLVEKRSLPHTTVQWTSPTTRCPELAGCAPAGVAVCTRLRASIEEALREGRLRVTGGDG
ncbi:hypothetical protein ABZ820_13530 [Streptomyces diacarni]|uniref:hypothetical protein n=1 Tax=Streptomyces diacarni TaxID=2800381 RepID=UPI001C68B0D9|nr:hypothetical protein [Streptomyces diacarni]